MAASDSGGAHIVTLRAGVEPEKVCHECKVKAGRTFRHAFRGFAATLDAEQVARLKQRADVLAVEPDGPVVLCEQTNGAGIVRMGLTNFPFARINGLDERFDADVAVLDTGIDLSHPDLNVFRVVGFADTEFDGEPLPPGHDWHGHGTRMAGTIGALDNDQDVVGIVAGARLWSVQVMGPTQSTWTNVLAGMEYVAEHAAEIEVLNCSFVSDGWSPIVAIQEAFRNVVNQGVVVVAGVGNTRRQLSGPDRIWGTEDDLLPAGLPEVMAVSSMDPSTDLFASLQGFSQRGRLGSFVISPGGAIDVAAPGVGIFSTKLGGGTSTGSGTSSATAHASGLVALYIAANGRATNAEGVYRIRHAIVDSGLPQSQWKQDPDDLDDFPEPLAVASESWIPAPRIVEQNPTPAGFQFSFTTIPGYDYVAERIRALAASNAWTRVALTNGTGNHVTVLDPTSDATGFYRVTRQSPAP